MRRCARAALGAALAATTLASAAIPVAAQAADSAAAAARARIVPLPILFYQEETKWGFGAGLIRMHHAVGSTRTSTDQLLLIGTQRKQYSMTLGTERYTAGDRYLLRGQLSLSRFPSSFFGLGNETRATDEELYTPDVASVQLEVRRALRPALYVGAGGLYEHASLRTLEPDGRLAAGEIAGTAAGSVAGIGAGVALDRREHVVAPAGGEYLALQAIVHGRWLGSDYGFTRIEADARAYRRVGPGVVAVQALLAEHRGEPPFYRLSTLGGANVMRGSFEGRYRDRARAVLQGELRLPVRGRFGAVAFAAAGQVAPGVERLRADALHYAAGGGVRFVLVRAERAAIRIDYAVCGRESGVYFALGEAF